MQACTFLKLTFVFVGSWYVGDDGAGEKVLVLEGERIGERFERRTGGARREGSVDLPGIAAVEVGRAMESQDFPRLVVDDNNRPLGMLDITDVVSLTESSDRPPVLPMRRPT